MESMGFKNNGKIEKVLGSFFQTLNDQLIVKGEEDESGRKTRFKVGKYLQKINELYNDLGNVLNMMTDDLLDKKRRKQYESIEKTEDFRKYIEREIELENNEIQMKRMFRKKWKKGRLGKPVMATFFSERIGANQTQAADHLKQKLHNNCQLEREDLLQKVIYLFSIVNLIWLFRY